MANKTPDVSFLMDAFRIACFFNRHIYDQKFDEIGISYARTLLMAAVKKDKSFVITELQRTVMQVIDGIQLAIFFRVARTSRASLSFYSSVFSIKISPTFL